MRFSAGRQLVFGSTSKVKKVKHNRLTSGESLSNRCGRGQLQLRDASISGGYQCVRGGGGGAGDGGRVEKAR